MFLIFVPLFRHSKVHAVAQILTDTCTWLRSVYITRVIIYCYFFCSLIQALKGSHLFPQAQLFQDNKWQPFGLVLPYNIHVGCGYSPGISIRCPPSSGISQSTWDIHVGYHSLVGCPSRYPSLVGCPSRIPISTWDVHQGCHIHSKSDPSKG